MKNLKKFRMNRPGDFDKSFAIYNEDIRLSVDYDDVDHPKVRRVAKRVLEALNNYEDLKFQMEGLQK